MAIVKSIFSNFLAFLLAAIMTAIPYKGVELPIIKTLDDDCRLNVELISDVHITSNEFIRQGFLKSGLKNLNKSISKIDAVVVDGDITNYADEASLAKYFEITDNFSPVPVITVAGNHDAGHAGDRDVTNITREQALQNFINYRNKYMDRDDRVNYFSTEINGYKFIILGDEVIDGGHWDAISMTEEQLKFLDSELADGTRGGRPVFVFCHWPIANTNGENVVWPDSGISKEEYDLQSILERYRNVFYISGHMHSGIKATVIKDWFGLSNAEQINGVNYITLPTYGIVNMFGSPWPCGGSQLEVYKDEVVVRPRNFLTNKWYKNAEVHFALAPVEDD